MFCLASDRGSERQRSRRRKERECVCDLKEFLAGLNDNLAAVTDALTFVANLWALRELLSSPNGSPVASGRH